MARIRLADNNGAVFTCLESATSAIDLLHKSEKGEAFADKNPAFADKSGRKCFAPTAEIDFCKRSIFHS
jgi:hypothetical protein